MRISDWSSDVCSSDLHASRIALLVCILVGELRRIVIFPRVLTCNVMATGTAVYHTPAFIAHQLHGIGWRGVVLLPAGEIGFRAIVILVHHGEMVVYVTEFGVHPLLAAAASRYAHGQLKIGRASCREIVCHYV